MAWHNSGRKLWNCKGASQTWSEGISLTLIQFPPAASASAWNG